MLSDFVLEQDSTLKGVLESLCEALIRTAAAGRETLHLRVDIREFDGKKAVLFTSGSPEQKNAYTTMVPDLVAERAYAAAEYFISKYTESFSGFELLLRKQGSIWRPSYHLLIEPSPDWDLPQTQLRVCGHGFSLVPNRLNLFRWRYEPSAARLIATCRPSTMNLNIVKKIQIDYAEGKFEVRLGEGVAAVEQVLEVSEGPFYPFWLLETPAFWLRWPEQMELCSPLASQTRFEFVDDAGSILFVQGPFLHDEVVLSDLIGEGQTESFRGESAGRHQFVEFSYRVDENDWLQRHYLNRSAFQHTFVITAQAQKENATRVFAAADLVVDSLKPL